MADLEPRDHETPDPIDESIMDQARAFAAEIGDPFVMLRTAIEMFQATPSASLPDPQLGADVIRLRRQMGRLDAVFAEYALGSHRRGICGHDAYRSTPAWLAWQTGMHRGQVQRATNTADLAELLPAMGAAWRAGTVSTNAMEAISAARVPGHDDTLAACETEFLDLATRGDHAGVRRAAAKFKACAHADGTRPVEPDGLRLAKVLDGRTTLTGEFSNGAAETITTALHAFTDPPSDTDDRTPAQRRADALVRICQTALAHGTAGTRASATVTIVIDWATLLNHGLDTGLDGRMDGHYTGPIDRHDIDRLLCDSRISRVITGPKSETLDVGRATRAFPEPTRRAIIARDHNCRWPGCETPAGWCDIHHHQHWQHDGTTSATNGVLLCPHHHRFLHRNPTWTTTFYDQHFRVYRPNGTELDPHPWAQLAA